MYCSCVAKKPPPHIYDVETEVDGQRHTGTYSIQSGVITVNLSGHGSKSTQIGASPAEHLAKLLLGELVIAGRRR